MPWKSNVASSKKRNTHSISFSMTYLLIYCFFVFLQPPKQALRSRYGAIRNPTLIICTRFKSGQDTIKNVNEIKAKKHITRTDLKNFMYTPVYHITQFILYGGWSGMNEQNPYITIDQISRPNIMIHLMCPSICLSAETVANYERSGSVENRAANRWKSLLSWLGIHYIFRTHEWGVLEQQICLYSRSAVVGLDTADSFANLKTPPRTPQSVRVADFWISWGCTCSIILQYGYKE